MKLFQREFTIEETMFNLRKDLLKLKSKVLAGDYKAAVQAREKLEQLEELNIEFINN